jgi:hypothetical protein
MRRVRAHAVVGRSRAAHRRRYAAYMASPQWRGLRCDWVKREEQRTGQPVRCAVCGSEEWDDLHHMTYSRMGNEQHGDLVALCRAHHDELHAAYDAGRWRGMDYGTVMRRLLRLLQEQHRETTA